MRPGGVDLRVVDAVVAAALTVASIAAAPRIGDLGLVGVAACVAAPASLAFRRRYPLPVSLVAMTSLAVLQVVGGRQVSIQPLAVQLAFYLLGRKTASGERAIPGMALGYALVAVVLIAVVSGGPTPVGVATAWAMFVGLPFVIGRTFTRRTELRRTLEQTTADLGENTVKTHVTRVLTKIGVRDRVQAVVLAYETGVVNRRRDPTA
jgi:hypothetical protein